MGTRVVKAAVFRKRNMLLRFVSGSAQISPARAATADTLAAWGMPDLVDDAELVVSELLTNGLIASGETVVLNLAREKNGIFIGVWDSSPRMPVVRHPGDLTEDGRGLHIVKALSSEHGCHRAHAGGKLAWARLTTAN